MDGRPTWTDCDESGDYVVPNVLSPRDLVFRPDNIDETVPHTSVLFGTQEFPKTKYNVFKKLILCFSSLFLTPYPITNGFSSVSVT